MKVSSKNNLIIPSSLPPTFMYFRSMVISEEELRNEHTPTGQQLDEYLAHGYYRMRQFMFTTFYIEYEEHLHDVFWLRTLVNKIDLNVIGKKLTKLNQRFTHQVKPFAITAEHEELFQRYRDHVTFVHTATVHENLLGEASPEKNIFNTKLIEVRDGDQLIAFGYFDEGENAIMGLLNVYHPDYKKHSLGKYLILLKLAYCQQQHLEFYYTGYIALGLHHFDYKTYPSEDAVEVLIHTTQAWLPFNQFGKQGLEPYGLLQHFLQQED